MKAIWQLTQGIIIGAAVVTFVLFPVGILCLYSMATMLRWFCSLTGI
jgi:hypothetical protein